ncbi:Retrotransposon gag protein, partial [Aspergillus sclerotialis]
DKVAYQGAAFSAQSRPELQDNDFDDDTTSTESIPTKESSSIMAPQTPSGSVVGGPTSSTKIQGRAPDTFDGTPSKMDHFLGQLSIYFGSTGETLTGNQKVMIAASYLRGSALDWFQTYLDEWEVNKCANDSEKRQVMTEYSQFRNAIAGVFGDIDRKKNAERKLHHLVQRGKASEYAREFLKWTRQAGWDDDDTNMGLYERGLRPEVQYEVVKGGPYEDLPTLIMHSVRIDNQLYELRQLRQGRRFG